MNSSVKREVLVVSRKRKCAYDFKVLGSLGSRVIRTLPDETLSVRVGNAWRRVFEYGTDMVNPVRLVLDPNHETFRKGKIAKVQPRTDRPSRTG